MVTARLFSDTLGGDARRRRDAPGRVGAHLWIATRELERLQGREIDPGLEPEALELDGPGFDLAD